MHRFTFMSIDYQLTRMSDENALVNGEKIDHDEPQVQKSDTLHHYRTSISDDITTSTAQSHDDG